MQTSIGMENRSDDYREYFGYIRGIVYCRYVFLLIVAPLVSLGVLRLFQGRKRSGFTLIGSGVLGYFVFQLVAGLFS